jgi:hypothetical protein
MKYSFTRKENKYTKICFHPSDGATVGVDRVVVLVICGACGNTSVQN